MYAPFWEEIILVLFSMQVHVAKTESNFLTMTAFLADGDPPSDRITRVLTPHTEGHTSGQIADLSRVNKTLVPIEMLHGTQPAVEVSVAADFFAPIDHHSTIHTHHEHQPSRTSSAVLPLAVDPDSINKFNAFYDAFIQSPTYARANSNNNQPSIVDDDDDDVILMETQDATMTLTHRLRLTLQELGKVNRHLSHILKQLTPAPANNPSPATTAQPSLPLVANMQQPKLYPEPPRECALQCVIVCAPPPAPDPVAIPLKQQAPLTDGSRIAPESPHAPLPDPRAHCRPTRHSPIPNWAKPAVPCPTPMVGVVYAGQTHWPPPRPPKPAPFKKKPQTKPALVIRRQEKDSLCPP